MKPLSASQIQTWIDCPRKWAAKYVAKLPDPQKPSAKVGTRVHAILESWLRDGTPPDRTETMLLPDGKGGQTRYWPGKTALAIMRHLPKPGTVETERRITFERDGVSYLGFIDWLDLEVPKIADHKTTASLRYAKSADELRTDPQALIYGAWARNAAASGSVDLQWTYGETKGSKHSSRKVELTLTTAAIEAGWAEKIQPAADGIMQARRELEPSTWKEATPNAKACDMFGGCPFKSKCQLSNSDKMRSFMSNAHLLGKDGPRASGATGGEKTMGSILDKIKADKAAKAGGGDAAAPAQGDVKSMNGEINPPGEAADVPEGYGEKKKPAAPEIEAAEKPAPAPAPQAEHGNYFTLFVDCVPLAGYTRVFYLHELFAPAADSVCEDAGVQHYRHVEYGKGPGAVAAQLEANLRSAPLGEGVAVCTSARTPEGRETLETLSALAGAIVRGL